jgi:hypothetical protein
MKLKRTVSMILAAVMIFGVLSLASCGEASDAPSGMKLASNEIVDYSFYVPVEWVTDLAAGAVGAYFSSADPSSVSVMAWNIEDPSITLDSWWEGNVEDFNLAFDNFNLEDSSNVLLNGMAAKKYVYTASLTEHNYKFIQVSCIARGMIYLFTYTSTVENFDTHIEDVDMMIENFKFN